MAVRRVCPRGCNELFGAPNLGRRDYWPNCTDSRSKASMVCCRANRAAVRVAAGRGLVMGERGLRCAIPAMKDQPIENWQASTATSDQQDQSG